MKKAIYWILIAVLLCVFLFSAYSLVTYFIDSMESQSAYSELEEIMASNRPTRPAPTQPPVTEATEATGTVEATEATTETVPPATEPELVTVTDPESGEEVQLLPEFAELYVMNNDLVGWIQIPDTDISYPVMQTPNKVDYYLRRDFYGKYSTHGCIYAREKCDVFEPSDNITIYGHRMKDGTMFAQLLNYDEKEYYESHRYIYFDTLTERHTYEIISVFKTTATIGEGFRYHLFVEATDEADFMDYVNTCKKLDMYETGVTAEYGDKLISLSTCEYSQTNGRLVVVAKRID